MTKSEQRKSKLSPIVVYFFCCVAGLVTVANDVIGALAAGLVYMAIIYLVPFLRKHLT